MNLTQTAAILAKIQLGDNRDISQLVIQEWHDIIGDLDYSDTVDAVRMHRAESLSYLMPAHLIANARLIRSRRERTQRIKDQAARRALPPAPITLNRAEFERITQEMITHHRRQRADAKS